MCIICVPNIAAVDWRVWRWRPEKCLRE